MSRNPLNRAARLGAATVAVLCSIAAARVAHAQTPSTPAGIAVMQSAKGRILTDSRGYTLYVSDADVAGQPACNAGCAQTWPPYLATPGAPPVGAFTVVARPDGTHQWAYGGQPLYRYGADAAPGATSGDGAGGTWHVARWPPAAAGPGALRTIAQTKTKSAAPTSYRALDTSTATKTDTPIMVTPLDVQVVTQQVLQDQQVVNIGQAIRNVSGVNVGAGGAADNGQPFSSIFLRGFVTDAHFRDGIRIDSFGGDSNTFGLQFANVESVDVLKGPAAVLYGAVEPGGIVNVVTKQPLTSPYYEVEEQAGSYDSTRTSFDATGPLAGDGHLLYRLNASFANSASFVNYVYQNDAFVAPVLRWNVDPATQFTFEYEYHHLNFGQNYGFVLELNGSPVNPSIAANYGDVSSEIEVSNFFALTWSQLMHGGWNVKSRLVFNNTYTDGAGIIPSIISKVQTMPSGLGVGRGINSVHNTDDMWTPTTDFTKHADAKISRPSYSLPTSCISVSSAGSSNPARPMKPLLRGSLHSRQPRHAVLARRRLC